MGAASQLRSVFNMAYLIKYEENNEHFYLNHAYLSACAFGSLDMAWSTDDREKANLMLYKVRDTHPHLANIEIEGY